MEKSIKNFKKNLFKLFISIFLFGLNFKGNAQSEQMNTKNFVGSFLTLDLVNSSHAEGFEYERIYFSEKKFSFGARAAYTFKYKSENFSLFDISGGGGSNKNLKISLFQIWGTAYLYFSEGGTQKGFFFNTALGFTHYKVVKQINPGLGPDNSKSILPSMEFGAGVKLSISQKNDLRIMTFFSFTSGKEEPGFYNHFVLLGGKISFGF